MKKRKSFIWIIWVLLGLLLLANVAMVVHFNSVNHNIDSEDTVLINELNFPDEIFRGYIEKFDVDNNGKLSKEELEAVKKINVEFMDIFDMTGIEYFSNLQILDCGNNQISSLNVSQNPNLIEIHCQVNQLTSLDISNNPSLLNLYCGNNQIMSLDTSHNPNLEGLRCFKNQISTLDISHNPNLEVLSCENNLITSLDISHNPNLENLFAAGNTITSLDFSQNTKLESFFVSMPLYQKGQEFYLDLSGMKLDKNKLILDKQVGTYDSVTGRIFLQEPLEVGDRLEYEYNTEFLDENMEITITISEIIDVSGSN